jgi:hypothetical protein
VNKVPEPHLWPRTYPRLELNKSGVPALVSAMATIIPGVSSAKDFYDEFVGSQNSRRLEEFVNAVRSDLHDLIKDVQQLKGHLQDDVFAATFVRLLDHVRRTADENKLEYLRNAAVNLSFVDLDATKKEVLTELVGRLSAIDIYCMQLYQRFSYVVTKENETSKTILLFDGNAVDAVQARARIQSARNNDGIEEPYFLNSVSALMSMGLISEIGDYSLFWKGNEPQISIAKLTDLGRQVLSMIASPPGFEGS